jgi:RNA polymerase sigma factor (sigma-70 family)
MNVVSRAPATGQESAPDDSQDEAALVSRAAMGDESAWELIIAKHRPRLISIARAHRLSPEEISDAMQETWANAFEHLSDLRDLTRFHAWLNTIMRRSCISVIRHRRCDREQLFGDMTDVPERWLHDEGADLEHQVLAAERVSALRQALDLLPPRQRELLHHFASDDPSYGEITRRLSMPMGSIGPTRMRALRQLRQLLEGQHDDLRHVA